MPYVRFKANNGGWYLKKIPMRHFRKKSIARASMKQAGATFIKFFKKKPRKW